MIARFIGHVLLVGAGFGAVSFIYAAANAPTLYEQGYRSRDLTPAELAAERVERAKPNALQKWWSTAACQQRLVPDGQGGFTAYSCTGALP